MGLYLCGVALVQGSPMQAHLYGDHSCRQVSVSSNKVWAGQRVFWDSSEFYILKSFRKTYSLHFGLKPLILYACCHGAKSWMELGTEIVCRFFVL